MKRFPIKSSATRARSLIAGHTHFLLNNTGDTIDPEVQHYVLNDQGVLANNRHFIGHSRMEYQPNGDGTTEGQSLLVLGYAYAYLATKNRQYLDLAETYWQAYVDHFYAGQAIPETPQRWICNWIVNSKEPVLAHYPLEPNEPTHGGFKGVELPFVNGFTVIPHDTPRWGQYLDVATFAFEGVLAWDAINASVQAELPDGTADWENDGIQYDVDWIITWHGDKVNSNGDILSSGHPLNEIGQVQLKNTTLTGTYKFNYATRQPVEHGGYLIGRNEVQHNRPLQVPLSQVNNMGNASDGEQWFIDASYLLWRITEQSKYQKAMNASLYTAFEYTQIDSTDKFFRQSTAASTPYTDGISYSFRYPNTVTAVYGRDAEGYITIKTDAAVEESLEQQAVAFRISAESSIRTAFGGVDVDGGGLTAEVQVLINSSKSDEGGVLYGASLPVSTSLAVVTHDVPVIGLVRLLKDDGKDYLLSTLLGQDYYDGLVLTQEYETGILGARQSVVAVAQFPNDDAGFEVDFSPIDGGVAPMTSITYRSNAEFDVRITDADNWRWYWILPNTAGAWSTFELNQADMVLSGYQPDHPSDPDPAAPNFTTVDSFTVLLENSGDTNKEFALYCVNEVPPAFSGNDGYTVKYRLTISGEAAFNARVGDCTVIDYRDDSLAYSPGVIPFSNIYVNGTDQFGAWHGMPYPGYQHPMIYCLDATANAEKLSNMVNFLWDSQQAYHDQFGVLGPVAAAYIWNRWDNTIYGPADTWTMYHFGDSAAWSGYQPRAFMGGARALYELYIRGESIPEKLQQFTDQWVEWLVAFIDENDGHLPYEYPPDAVPYVGDFTGHMTGLYLGAACFCALSGCTVPGIERLIEACVTELQENYVVTSIPDQPMNGSWSPAVRLGSDNGMFYGFWAGEILRGLGLYIIWKDRIDLTDILGVST